MGEYTYRGNECVKIGVLDEAFFSREELLKAKCEGWGAKPGRAGLPDGADELEGMLRDTTTLYRLPIIGEERPFSMNDAYVEPRPPIFAVPFEFPVLGGRDPIKHRKYVDGCGIHNNTMYMIPCVCLPEAKPMLCCPPDHWEFAAIGERYDGRQTPRTIFECASCGAKFNLREVDLKIIRSQAPEWIKLHPHEIAVQVL